MTSPHVDEWQARRELAACYRLFDHLGWAEAIFNHITLRVPGEGSEPCYLINPFGLHYSEVTAANLVKVNLRGEIVGDASYPVNRAGYVIHGAIHAARSDAHCVMHVHTTAGSAVACKASGLRHDNFYSAMMWGQIGYHDFEGVTTSLDEQPRLVTSLGAHPWLILRNHGILAVGSNLPEAFQRLWMLQRACEIQLASDAGQGPNIAIAESVLAHVPQTRKAMQTGSETNASLMFHAMLRRAGIDLARM
ncbi:MAG: class II aldolase/adducin family protein [Betaproteobacteria bacterium]|jgi:ribulose-5-phosphate 4-epimerase/fuculose-1-phosphate aldolase|nr:class II aldolase/adducin family protein [Betaproteobacteria bacterium]NBS45439.1 class II aldolase/adducin family protein [Betaproteobacteria bacterium]